MKQIYEMRGAGHSTRAIARELGLARNTVLRYLKSPEAIRPKPRSRRGSKLDPYTEHIDRRLGDGLENCVVLLRELRDLGYDGSNTILSEYVRPRRRRRRCRQALGQQQDGVPPFPLPGCGSQNHTPPQVLDSHLPLFQRPVYLPHVHHQPLAISETSYLGSFTNLPHASAHFTLALV